ncbi:MAG: DNA primase [Sphingomonadaceae bacterium]
MALSAQWLDELRQRVTLSSIIMRTTKLQKAGQEWKACCPFHNEKTPSFTVNDGKGFYHCFGCGAHGDVIRWMTDQRGLQFMDAVKELAAEAGMEVPAPDPQAARQAQQRASLHDVMQAAQDWFADNLRAASGKEAASYLQSRGFSKAIVEQFGFGFAPQNRQALKPALGDYDEAMLVEAGLRIAVDDKEPYDRFRARLMLPIHDARGRVIAFGGRILDAGSKAPKYLNSPDTPLFDKGRTLYNLHRAGPASRQSGRLVVVEGYMDVIALANAGITDAVAPLGTALTERQLALLWRLVPCPILCFDGDAAGKRAAARAIARALPLLQPSHSLAIVHLPDGLDPDDLIRARGSKAMDALLGDPRSLLDTLWEIERDSAQLDTPEAKAGLKARLMGHVDMIAHPDIKALYRRELLEKFSAFAFPPRPRTDWKKQGYRARSAPSSRLSDEAFRRLSNLRKTSSRDSLTSAVFHGLLRFPDQILRHEDSLLHLATLDRNLAPSIHSLLEITEMLEQDAKSPISEPIGPDAPPDNTRFAFLGEGLDPQVAREELAEALALLVERPALDAALAAATSRFETEPDAAFAEQQRLLKRKLDFEHRLRQMASKRASRVIPETDNSAFAPERVDDGRETD